MGAAEARSFSLAKVAFRLSWLRICSDGRARG